MEDAKNQHLVPNLQFGKMTVAELMAALASPEPTPGGGTAAAVAGAMGVSLLVMVAGLAKSKNNTDDEKAALATARAALEPLAARLMQLADADTDAFKAVMAAYRLPKATDEEKAARTAAIQAALRGATTVPLDTLRACADAIAHGRTVADFGNRAAASDVGVAIGLLKAAAGGAAENVAINLASMKDESFRSATAADMARLSETASAGAAAAMQSVAG
jgi:formiminotetrahydrofolate cyclodeaminase